MPSLLTFSASFLLALVASATTVAGEEAAGGSLSIFGPSPGSVSSYDLVIESEDSGASSSARYGVRVLRPAGESSDRAALLFQASAEDGEREREVELIVLRLRSDGLLLSDRRNDVGPEKGDAIGALFASVEGPAASPPLDDGAEWSRQELVPVAIMPLALPVSHRVARPSPNELHLASTLVGEKILKTLGYGFTLKEWSRKLQIALPDARPVRASVAVRSEAREPGKEPREYWRTVRLEESGTRGLSAEESRSLGDEIARLEKAVEALAGRSTGGGGLLAAIFGGGKRPEPVDPVPILDGYEKAHPEGFLRPALAGIRRTALARLEQQRRARELEEKAAALIGAEAPDFTLEDLEGKKVALSDYRGKVVLLAFWGYG